MRRLTELVPSLPTKPAGGHRSKASDSKKAFAAALRRNPTRAYEILWSRLRRKALGVTFRRRTILFGWIPDFWCPAARIAVEIDYESDADRAEEYRHRDKELARRGVLVFRIPAARIYTTPDQVVNEILLLVQDSTA